MRQIAVGVFSLVALFISCGSALAAPGANVQFFGPSVYNSNTAVMDTALGISGYTIEGFESASPLAGGVSVTLTGWFGDPNGFPLTTSTPTRQPRAELISQGYPNVIWDGDWVMNNARPVGYAPRVIFNLPPNTTGFGIGLSDISTGTAVKANGLPLLTDLQTLPNFSSTDRSGYLLVTGVAGGFVTSVELSQINVTNFIDAIRLDHMAILVVPEPGAAAGFAGIIFSIGAMRRRSKRTLR